MFNNLKAKLKNNNKYYILLLAKTFLTRTYWSDLLHIRRKPIVLQMPITSRCNSRCVTCNVWKQKDNVDIDPERLRVLLSNKYFSNVQVIGLNGGELSLVKNVDDIFDAVLTCKKLKHIFVISNGLLPVKLLPLLERNKIKCNAKGVKLNFQLSVDGYGKVHEDVRGMPNTFGKTKQMLDALKENRGRYADNVSIGCTISQTNIPYMRQTEVFLSQYGFPVQYHLAVPNKRIHTFDDSDRYFVLADEYSTMLATEYFYGKFLDAQGSSKYSYFCQYYYLLNNGEGRLSICPYLYRDITIDERLKMYLCATASDELGDTSVDSVEVITGKKRLGKLESQVRENCDTCVHYIYDNPTFKGYVLFVYYLLKHRFDWGRKFEILAR